MSLVVVETTYETPLTDAMRTEIEDRLELCARLRGVEWLRSFESTDRRRKICLFRAPDADAMREALRTAGVGYDRVWSTSHREPDPDDPSGAAVRVTL